MAALAAVMLAHDRPEHVHRLVRALDGVDVFVHCDSRTAPEVFAAITTGLPDVVAVTPRHRTARSSWGMVEGELAGLRLALERSRAEHIIVCSGSCYPLVTVADLEDELSVWRGLTRIERTPLPYRGWSSRTRRHPDGGFWRLNQRFLTRGERIVLAPGGHPIPLYRRRIPSAIKAHASSQWKIYARKHAETLLRVLDERPELVRYWRTTFNSDESCVASILSSPELVGAVADELQHDRAWYIDWRGKEVGGHPRWLDVEDFPRLEEHRNLAPLRPGDSYEQGDRSRKLFARKFGTDDEVLDLIDAKLRV
jgi:hypothetical protein